MAFGKRKNSASGDVPEIGAIFMSNRATKRECFRRKLLGLPSAFCSFIKQVKAGMLLFLFEYETRSLYGVYQACSDGEMNIVPDAYNSTGRRYPAQVLFRTLWYCSPLSEKEFSFAIRDNYFAPYKFNFGLSRIQVHNLLRLFTPRIKRDSISRDYLFRDANSICLQNANWSEDEDAITCDVENEYVPQYVHNNSVFSEDSGVSVLSKNEVQHRFLGDGINSVDDEDTLTCDVDEVYVPEYVPQSVHDELLFSDSRVSVLSEKAVQHRVSGDVIKDTGDETIDDKCLSLTDLVPSLSDQHGRDDGDPKNILVEQYEPTRFVSIGDKEGDKICCTRWIENLDNEDWSLSSDRTSYHSSDEGFLREGRGKAHVYPEFYNVLSGIRSQLGNSNTRPVDMSKILVSSSSDSSSCDHPITSYGALTFSDGNPPRLTTKNISRSAAANVLSSSCSIHSDSGQNRFIPIKISEDVGSAKHIVQLRSMPKDTSYGEGSIRGQPSCTSVNLPEKFRESPFAECLPRETHCVDPNLSSVANCHSMLDHNSESSNQDCISRRMEDVSRSGSVFSRLKPASGTAMTVGQADKSRSQSNSSEIVDEVMNILDEHYRYLIREKKCGSTVKVDADYYKSEETRSDLPTMPETQCPELVTTNFYAWVTDGVSKPVHLKEALCVDFKRRSEMRKVHNKANVQGAEESSNVISSNNQWKRRKLIRPRLSHKELSQESSSQPHRLIDEFNLQVPSKDGTSSTVTPSTQDGDNASSSTVANVLEGDADGCTQTSNSNNGKDCIANVSAGSGENGLEVAEFPNSSERIDHDAGAGDVEKQITIIVGDNI